jgi:hypothetical protein
VVSALIFIFSWNCESHHHLRLFAIIQSMDTQAPPAAAATIAEGGGEHGSNNKPHVLVVPFPAHGHMLALIDLVALLATRGGLAVTVAVTSGNVPVLEPLLAACPSVGVVTLAFPSSSAFLPPGCGENTKELPFHVFRIFIPALAALRAPLLSWCVAQRRGRRVTAIVSDMFTGWTRPLADEIGARHVMFSPCSALWIAVFRSLWCRMPARSSRTHHAAAAAAAAAAATDDDDEAAAVVFPEVTGAPSFAWRQLSTLYRHHKDGDEASEAIRRIILWSLASECVVVNSFAALEAAYLEHPAAPSSTAAQAPPRRVLAVGPVSEAWANSSNRGGKPAVALAEVASWLDAFAVGSVVYVSFGTQFALSPEQAARVADALALSSAPFLWAAGALTVVPEGFEASTASRGMVVRGWVPQVEILRHRAVGWFLMHCGMNAVLEAAAAGVAMLTWPMGADHFVNRMLLREAGVAVHVAEGADAVPDAGEVAKAIAAAVGEQGKPIRERAAELGRKAVAAVAAGGSSHTDLQELVGMLASGRGRLAPVPARGAGPQGIS